MDHDTAPEAAPGPPFTTILLEQSDGVAWVTLNRPEALNAFDETMQRELHAVWRALRDDDGVRVVVLTGAGDRAFCSGIDRRETMGPDGESTPSPSSATALFHYEDPGEVIGPKSANLWKPVIGAVNGLACGGAFYLLGECDFLIAAEHATFFDPHVTYNMTAAYEPTHLLTKMPLPEVLRMALLGNHERLSAARAHQVGLVSQVVPAAELLEAAGWAARAIAAAPPLAITATLRAIWAANELSRSQALSLGYAFVGLGNDPAQLEAGQAGFSSRQRPEWRLR
jgi:enoyl-CoA hydratase/carnithine racemase